MEKRLSRSKSLLNKLKSGMAANVMFSDEKLFTVQSLHNRQNDDQFLAPSIDCIPREPVVTRTMKKPASVMVWAAITSTGKSPLVFV
jgi:hypothetical protein